MKWIECAPDGPLFDIVESENLHGILRLQPGGDKSAHMKTILEEIEHLCRTIEP